VETDVQTQSREGSSQSTFREQLDATPQEEQHKLVLQLVHSEVARVLGLDPSQPLNPRQGLMDIGLDSLMAIELSNRLQRSVGHSLPSTLSFEYPTIEAIANFLAKDILGLTTAEETPEASNEEDQQKALIEEVEAISEDELEDALLKELKDAGY
jgi:acyl carrier protein